MGAISRRRRRAQAISKQEPSIIRVFEEGSEMLKAVFRSIFLILTGGKEKQKIADYIQGMMFGF